MGQIGSKSMSIGNIKEKIMLPLKSQLFTCTHVNSKLCHVGSRTRPLGQTLENVWWTLYMLNIWVDHQVTSFKHELSTHYNTDQWYLCELCRATMALLFDFFFEKNPIGICYKLHEVLGRIHITLTHRALWQDLTKSTV